MFFLSVISQHSVLNLLSEDPEVTEIKTGMGEGRNATMQMRHDKKVRRNEEDALLNPNKLVGWLHPSCPVTHEGQSIIKSVK